MSGEEAAEQESFRQEIADCFAAPRVRAAMAGIDSAHPDPRPVYRLLGERRLLAPSWPAELGGRDAPSWAAAIVAEELVARGVPDMLHVLSVQSVGTGLLAIAGSGPLRRRLRSVAKGESFACVLFSEPDAGSDLTALRTEAAPAEAGYRLRGTKIYALAAGYADFGLCLARTTDAGQPALGGLAFFIVPMDSPGLRTRAMGGLLDDELYRVDLDDVKLTPDALVGRPGDGWPLALRILVTERTGIDYYARARHWYSAVERQAAEVAGTASQVPAARLAHLGAQVDAAALLSRQSLRRLYAGKLTEGAAALSKWWTSELAARIAWAGVDWFGVCPDRTGGTILEAAHREAHGLLVSAGVSEVLLETMSRLRVQQSGAGALVAPDRDPVERELNAVIADAVSSQDAGQALANLGAFAFSVPLADGGLELGEVAVLMVCTELGRAGHPARYLDSVLAADMLSASGAGGSAREALALIAAGTDTAAVVGLVEPDACPLRATRDGQGWRLDGEAVRHAADPDWTVFVARAADPADLMVTGLWPGHGPGQPRGDEPSVVSFNDVRVGAADVLSSGHTAAAACVQALTRGRLRLAGYLTGLASGATELAAKRARERTVFGQRLADLPVVSTRLAALAGHAEVIELLIHDLAGRPGASQARPCDTVEALALASELAGTATRAALHVHGAHGITGDHAIQRYYLAAAIQATRYGHVDQLWRMAGEARMRRAAGSELAGAVIRAGG